MKPTAFFSTRPARHVKSPLIALAFLALFAIGCNNSESAVPTASISNANFEPTSTPRTQEKPRVNLQPQVQVHTSAGDFKLQLDAEHAPLTVENFLSYVNSGHYDGTIFHQVYSGFIVLGGGFDSQFNQRTTDGPVRNEAHNGLKNTRGTIAMARQSNAIDSATNQFFINLADNSSLDFANYDAEKYGYCVFGEVIEGMDVVDRIAKGEVHSTPQFENVPTQPVVIESIRCVK